MIRSLSLKLPLGAAAAIVAAAYLIRSLLIRNGDFSLDARDVIALSLFAAVAAGVALVRRRRPEDAEEHSAKE